MRGWYDCVDSGIWLPAHIKRLVEVRGHETKLGLVTIVVCFPLTLFTYLSENIEHM